MPRNDRSIVCHVDRTVDPSSALRCAQALSDQLGKRLVVAASAPAFAPLAGLLVAPDDPVGWAQAPAVLGRAACALGHDSRAEFRVVRGDASEALLDLADAEEADLIAVTSTGRGPMLSGLLGQPQAMLTPASTRPLLVVPETVAGGCDFDQVICGVDGSEESCDGAAVAAAIADGLRVPMKLVHAAPVAGAVVRAGTGELHGDVIAAQIEAAARLFDRATENLAEDLDPELELVYGDPVRQLTRAARGTAALFVVGARGRGPIKASLLGSVSSGLTAAADRPVVIVPPLAGRSAEAPAHAASG